MNMTQLVFRGNSFDRNTMWPSRKADDPNAFNLRIPPARLLDTQFRDSIDLTSRDVAYVFARHCVEADATLLSIPDERRTDFQVRFHHLLTNLPADSQVFRDPGARVALLQRSLSVPPPGLEDIVVMQACQALAPDDRLRRAVRKVTTRLWRPGKPPRDAIMQVMLHGAGSGALHDARACVDGKVRTRQQQMGSQPSHKRKDEWSSGYDDWSDYSGWRGGGSSSSSKNPRW